MPDPSRFKRPVNARKKDKNLPQKKPKSAAEKNAPKKEKVKKSKLKTATKAKPQAEKKTETTAEGGQ